MNVTRELKIESERVESIVGKGKQDVFVKHKYPETAIFWEM